MDLPLHLATGAMIGNALIFHRVTRAKPDLTRRAQCKLGLACFVTGVASHLLWDWMPHYDWLFYVEIFKPLPFFWLIPQMLTTLPVLLGNLYLNRDLWPLAVAAMAGSIYPDVEKLLYFDFHLPRKFVIFRQHSCYLTGWRPWELAHKDFLVWFEVVVFLIFVAMMIGFALARRNHRFFTGGTLWISPCTWPQPPVQDRR